MFLCLLLHHHELMIYVDFMNFLSRGSLHVSCPLAVPLDCSLLYVVLRMKCSIYFACFEFCQGFICLNMYAS